jgi:hypothetical protein
MGEILDEMTLNVATKERVSSSKYRQEMRDSKIVVSPFGWGEIGVRDFECWIYGACLVKPDMSHMETWPDVFVAGETYAPAGWGFKDLKRTIEELLDDGNKRQRIARAGRDAYRQMVSAEGMERFCQWFIQQVER